MKSLLLICLLSCSISLLAQEDQRSILADLYEGEYTQKGFGDGRVSSKDIKVIRENGEVVGLQFNKTRYELEEAAFPRYLKATTSFKLTVLDGYLIFWSRYGYGDSGDIYVKFVAHKRKVKGSSSKYVEMVEEYLQDTEQAYASAEKRAEKEQPVLLQYQDIQSVKLVIDEISCVPNKEIEVGAEVTLADGRVVKTTNIGGKLPLDRLKWYSAKAKTVRPGVFRLPYFIDAHRELRDLTPHELKKYPSKVLKDAFEVHFSAEAKGKNGSKTGRTSLDIDYTELRSLKATGEKIQTSVAFETWQVQVMQKIIKDPLTDTPMRLYLCFLMQKPGDNEHVHFDSKYDSERNDYIKNYNIVKHVFRGESERLGDSKWDVFYTVLPADQQLTINMSKAVTDAVVYKAHADEEINLQVNEYYESHKPTYYIEDFDWYKVK